MIITHIPDKKRIKKGPSVFKDLDLYILDELICKLQYYWVPILGLVGITLGQFHSILMHSEREAVFFQM